MQRPDDPHREELSPSHKERRPARPEEGADIRGEADIPFDAEERNLDLREERLTARKEMQRAGEVRFRKEVEEVPERLEVEAYREEVDVEHVPVDKVVQERVGPWEEGDTLVVPVYEEQLEIVKRLVMREQIRIRRVEGSERRLVEDTVRRERLQIDDQDSAGRVRERHSTGDEPGSARTGEDKRIARDKEKGGFLDSVARKIME